MARREYLFWPVVIVFYSIWTLSLMYLPIITATGAPFLLLEFTRSLLILSYFLGATVVVFHAPVRSAFALTMPTQLGLLLGGIYALSLIYYESTVRILNQTPEPWSLLAVPVTAIAEEMVFRGFIFTYLQNAVGRVQAVLMTSVLTTMFFIPVYIFVVGLQGESFITAIGQIFFFSLIQGVIRYYSRSVYPSIAVHIIRSILMLV